MIKYFCDRCGKETKIAITMPIYVHDGIGAVITQIDSKDICEDCAKKLAEIKDELVKKHYLQDFLLMSDNDIELFRQFKVGEKVITADGRVGHITDICTCDRCKERGFYEATVNFGDDYTDYIMDSDKKNGFKSFYSIGKRVYGNIDEESVNKEIDECKRRLSKLYEQGRVISLLIPKEESNN